MEKFSNFKDPLTGINPFLQPKQRKITWKVVVLFLVKINIYFLFYLGFPVLPLLIKIKVKSKLKPKGLSFCNSVSKFDQAVIAYVFRINSFKNFRYGNNVYFPEGTNTNNLAILKYDKDEHCDYSIGLKYTPDCVYMYGSKFMWLLRFLGHSQKVEINVIEGNDLSKATGLPQVSLTKKDKERFLLTLNKKD